MTVIHFPQFSKNEVTPFDMRQLVQALELRFQTLENANFQIFDTDPVGDEFAPLSHTHVEANITDLQHVTSIFQLDDVSGVPNVADTLVWNGAEFEASPPGAISLDLNDLGDVAVPAPNNDDVLTWDQGSGQWVAAPADSGGGIATTLFDLTDTDLDGQLQGDLLFNADGTEWQPSGFQFQWFDGQYVQLGNSIGVNWYNLATTSLEMLSLAGGPPAGVTPDPDIGSVVLLATAEGFADGATTFNADIGGLTFNAVTNGGGIAEVSSLNPKFGTRMIRVWDATGAVAAYFQTSTNAPALTFGANDFTIEMHVLVPSVVAFSGTQPFMGIYDAGDKAWAIDIQFQTAGDFRSFFIASSDGTNNTFGQQRLWNVGAANTWYHFAICRDGNNIRTFVDGVEKGTAYNATGFTMFTPTSAVFYIGETESRPTTGGPAQQIRYDNVRITSGVARYTTNFTPPSAPFDDGSQEETFFVSDSTVATQIDGTTTTITGAAQLDTTLNVDGISTLNNDVAIATTLDDATGDEVAFALDYITNKATSGADTGFQVSMTDTSSPGISLFADYRLGAISLFDWGIDGIHRIYDLTGADSAALSHDGTDFTANFTGTTDWNIIGLTGAFNVEHDTTAAQVIVQPVSATGQDAEIEIRGARNSPAIGTQVTSLLLSDFDDDISSNVSLARITSETVAVDTDLNEQKLSFYYRDASALDEGMYLYDGELVIPGQVFKITDNGETDWVTFAHDGTDFNTALTNTRQWSITGLSLAAATGDETAMSLAYTVNKATSGNDTGLLINKTDTLSQGVSRLLDVQVGGATQFNVQDDGVTNLGNFSFDTDQTVGAGQDNFVLTYDNALGTIQLEAAAGGPAAGTTTDSVLRWDGADWVEETQVRVSSAGALSIYDSTLADRAEFSHDGTDLTLDFPNGTTVDWNIIGTSPSQLQGVRIIDAELYVYLTSPATQGLRIGATTTGIDRGQIIGLGDLVELTGSDWYFSSSGGSNSFVLANDVILTNANYLFYNSNVGSATTINFQGNSGGSNPYWFDFRSIEGVATTGERGFRWRDSNFTVVQLELDTPYFALRGGTEFRMSSSLGDSLILDMDNTDVNLTVTGVSDWNIDGFTNVDLLTGADLRIFDSTNADNATLAHDGTDFNTTFSGTTDWNISGLTGVILPAINIEGSNANGPAFINEAASGTNPTLAPDKSDDDTGIGTSAADELSLVIGAIEGLRLSEASSDIIWKVEPNVGLTADAGSAQGNGVITSSYNVYSTVATTGDAATLPATFGVGTKIYVKNDGANSMDVFPASGDDAGAGTNVAVAVAAGDFAVFLATTADTTWTKIMGGTA